MNVETHLVIQRYSFTQTGRWCKDVGCFPEDQLAKAMEAFEDCKASGEVDTTMDQLLHTEYVLVRCIATDDHCDHIYLSKVAGLMPREIDPALITPRPYVEES
jgi:hypothetical protein